MKTRLILAVALLAQPLAAQALPKTIVLKERHLVCKHLSDMMQLTRLVNHGDAVAVDEFIKAKDREIIPGVGPACRYEPEGITVTVSDSSQGSGTPLECFRPSGFIACYWGIAIPAQ